MAIVRSAGSSSSLGNVSTVGAAVGKVLTATTVSGGIPTGHGYRGLDELIDTTPVAPADFGLVVPQGSRAYAATTGQTITAGAYPVYLDLNTVDYNDSSGLFTIDLTANKITVLSGGLYLASWEVSYTESTGGLREAYLAKNGGDALTSAGATVSGLAYRMTPLRLAANDYVQVICYVEGTNATLITNAAFRCGLALHRIGL
jgi:hypothetical protein